MHEAIGQSIDEVDAAVFSSDWLSDPEEREKLKEHLQAWQREIVRWEELDADSDEKDSGG